MAPSLAIFVYSTLVSGEQDRVAALVSYFLGVAGLLGPGRPGGIPGDGSPATASRRPSAAVLRPLSGAMASLAVVALVVIVAGAGLSGMRLTVFHVPPPAPRTGTAALGPGRRQTCSTGIALVDNLRAVEVSKSKR